jgi:hypothetical protein
VPGVGLGIALVEGVVVPVIELGSDPIEVLLCRAHGQLVALAGVRVVASGLFSRDDEAVVFGEARVPTLDVSSKLDELEQQVAGPLASGGVVS